MVALFVIGGLILMFIGHAIDVSQRLVRPIWEWVSMLMSGSGIALFLWGAFAIPSQTLCS